MCTNATSDLQQKSGPTHGVEMQLPTHLVGMQGQKPAPQPLGAPSLALNSHQLMLKSPCLAVSFFQDIPHNMYMDSKSDLQQNSGHSCGVGMQVQKPAPQPLSKLALTPNSHQLLLMFHCLAVSFCQDIPHNMYTDATRDFKPNLGPTHGVGMQV